MESNKNNNAPSVNKLTAREKKDNDKAVRMIILVACLDYAMVDVQNELESAGRFRQKTKKDFNMVNKLVIYAHNRFFTMLSSRELSEATKLYVKHTDDTWDNIDSNVTLPSLEGAYNKAISLCRLAMKYNNDLRYRYDCDFIDKFSAVERFLNELGETDYNLDFVVEKQLTY